VGGQVAEDPSLLEEVGHLVGAPVALRPRLSSPLELPREVLVSVMKAHQRYFPIERQGKLLPYFIAVRNGGQEGLEQVARGNEQVIRARFADAAYFVERDRRQPLESFLPLLERLTFHAKLGSMLAKSRRVEKLQPAGHSLKLTQVQRKTALRAARLLQGRSGHSHGDRHDLAAGVMGREYALSSAISRGGAGHLRALPAAPGRGRHPRVPPRLRPGPGRSAGYPGFSSRWDCSPGTSDPYGLRQAALGAADLIGADLPSIWSPPWPGRRIARAGQAETTGKGGSFDSVRSLQKGLASCNAFLLAREQTCSWTAATATMWWRP
jgi:glycyl-tRNA synthetase